MDRIAVLKTLTQMNEFTDLINIVPEQYRPSLGTVIALAMVLGRVFNSIRQGSGLVGMWNSLLYGTAVPKALEKRITSLESNSDTIQKP